MSRSANLGAATGLQKASQAEQRSCKNRVVYKICSIFWLSNLHPGIMSHGASVDLWFVASGRIEKSPKPSGMVQQFVNFGKHK